jgi:hypothetical protein
MSGSGVWVFKNGAVRLPEQPAGCERERKILVHKPSGEVDPDLFQFRNHCSVDLISLPKDFHKLNSIHMYDIVHKNSNAFHIVDPATDKVVPTDADQAEVADADLAADA